jgi:hypothetical protein
MIEYVDTKYITLEWRTMLKQTDTKLTIAKN